MTSRSEQYAAFNAVRKKTCFRSGLEVRVDELFKQRGLFLEYETLRIPYEIAAHGTYKADWVHRPSAIVIETKGEFTIGDRKKMLLVKQQHPNLDIRIIFSNPNTRIAKRSKTTYAMWCRKNEFPCCAIESIPSDWFTHTPTPAARQALDMLMRLSRDG